MSAAAEAALVERGSSSGDWWNLALLRS